MGWALAYKRGEAPDAPKHIREMADGMTEQQLSDFASKVASMTYSELLDAAMVKLAFLPAPGVTLPALAGAGLGAYKAPDYHKGEGAGRGATAGAGAGLGFGLGGLGGAALGSGLGAAGAGLLARVLEEQGGRMSEEDLQTLLLMGLTGGGLLGGLAGAPAGGVAGYRLANKVMGPPSWERDRRSAQDLAFNQDAAA